MTEPLDFANVTAEEVQRHMAALPSHQWTAELQGILEDVDRIAARLPRDVVGDDADCVLHGKTPRTRTAWGLWLAGFKFECALETMAERMMP